MAEQKSNNALKILTGVLAVALIALGIYTIRFYNEEKENRAILEREKSIIEDELDELIVRYDEAIAENQGLDSQLMEARGRIMVLRDSVQDLEANYAVIQRYRREVNELKLERERLFRVVDSLSSQNLRLASEIDSTNVVLQERTRMSDSLAQANRSLSTQVDRAAQLQVSNLLGEGVIERNSGRLVVNDRTRRIDKIRTCFTLIPNALAEAGEKDLYVQVYNQDNNLVGDQIVVQHEGGPMVYSAATTVYYENEELDVCILANTLSENLTAGTYRVFLYHDTELIGVTDFDLR